MAIWLRMDALFDSHPRGVAAGFWGRRAAEAAWRIIKLHGRRGEVGAEFISGENLARFAGCSETDVTDPTVTLANGMEAAIRAGLFERTADGRVRAHDWSERQIDPTGAERQEKFRQDHIRTAPLLTVSAVSNGNNDDGTGSIRDRTGSPPTPPKGETTPREERAQGFVRGTWCRLMGEVRGRPNAKPDEAGVVASGAWAIGMTEDEVRVAIEGLVRDEDKYVRGRGWSLKLLPERAEGYLSSRIAAEGGAGW